MTGLVSPYGGALCDLMLPQAVADDYRRRGAGCPAWVLSPRQLYDLELLLNGGFSPLCGFMSGRDYAAVVAEARLADGQLWPIPVTLDVPAVFAARLHAGSLLALKDPEGVVIAVMHVEDIWTPDRLIEADRIYGTRDTAHVGVRYLINKTHAAYVGGPVSGLEMPSHFDFTHLRHTPRSLREAFSSKGWERVAALRPRHPLHRPREHVIARAAAAADARVLVHPLVGSSPCVTDADHYTRVRYYEQALRHAPALNAALSLLPLATRLAGPREALWLAIVGRNFGCSHFMVEHDHAAPDGSALRERFYAPDAARALVAQHQTELGITLLPLEEIICPGGPAPDKTMPDAETEPWRLSDNSGPVPARFSYSQSPNAYRRDNRRGVTIFFTGLSGAGKSTIAKAVLAKLMENGARAVTLLDGDLVRKNLSSELGFSRAHRDLNILRIGFVASEITKHGGIALCAPIAPYQATRHAVREMVSAHGAFIEIYVATPLAVCEARDRKGLYAQARAGAIKEFTGISDPYEIPLDPELILNTCDCTPFEAAQMVLQYLQSQGHIDGGHLDEGHAASSHIAGAPPTQLAGSDEIGLALA